MVKVAPRNWLGSIVLTVEAADCAFAIRHSFLWCDRYRLTFGVSRHGLNDFKTKNAVEFCNALERSRWPWSVGGRLLAVTIL
jgi:hypothetical protein